MGQLSTKGGGGLQPPHLLDITMFWSPRSGGVARYLRNKRNWLEANSQWRHTIMAPGPAKAETSPIAALPLPFSGGYRFPLRRTATARSIIRHQPDLIEVGDPYRCAWAALDAGQRLGVPVTAFYHSNPDALAQHFLPRALRGLVRQLPAPFVSPVRHGLRSESLGRRSTTWPWSRQHRAATARRRLRSVSSAPARRRVASRARVCTVGHRADLHGKIRF